MKSMTPIKFSLFMGGIMIIVALRPAGAQVVIPREDSEAPEAPLTVFHFDEDPEGWASADRVSVVAVTTDENEVKVGAGALEYTYILPSLEQLQAGKTLPLLQSSLNMDFSAARALRFWLRTDQPTVFLVALTEVDGSDYYALFYSPRDAWQQVALSLDRFSLDEGSYDENGQLDRDQVYAVSLLDATFFISLLTSLPVGEVERQFWVDELEILPTEVPSAYGLDREEISSVVVDDFESGFLPWVPLYGALSLVEEQPTGLPGRHAMLWKHSGREGPLVALIRKFHLPPLPGFTQLRLWVRTTTATTLAVGFEELEDHTGEKSRYSQAFPIQPGEWREVVLPLAQFTLDEDSQDSNHQFDLNEVTTLFLVDAGALLGQTEGAEIWIDGIVLE